MLKQENVQRELGLFGSRVITDARSNLKRLDKNVSGKLSRSLRYETAASQNSIEFSLFMEEYGEFQDQGVSGTITKYDTPFAYTDKMPPPSALDGWSVRRGIAPRDEQGRFLPRQSVNYAIATSIFRHGIRPSHFLTDAFEDNFRRLPQDLAEAYGLDVDNFLEFALK